MIAINKQENMSCRNKEREREREKEREKCVRARHAYAQISKGKYILERSNLIQKELTALLVIQLHPTPADIGLYFEGL